MTTPFLDWMKQAIPEAEVEGNVVRLPDHRVMYTCADCGEMFISDWTDDDAATEHKVRYGTEPDSAAGYVCEVCYQNTKGN